MEQPPAIVIEGDACPDAARAEAALRDALGAAVAPSGGWRVRMNVRMRPSGVRVVAELDDGESLPVAHRELASASNRCEPLARGVGVWAALSLDAEVERAKRVEPKPPEPVGPWPAPATLAPNDEAQALLKHAPNKRELEVGVASSLMTGFGGVGTSPIAGGDAFMIVEVGHAIFLRPSAGFGAGVQGTASYWGAGRFDGCLRLPGNYIERSGLQFDACLGAEVAGLSMALASGGTDMRWMLAPGPSVALRGELASALSVEVRAVSGFNILLSGPSVDVLSLRAELGFTWRLR
jgi:hypothetical protein